MFLRYDTILFIEHRLPTGSKFAISGSHTWCVRLPDVVAANLLNPNISFSIFRFKDFLTKEYYQQCVNGEIIFKSRLAVVPNDSFFSNNYYLIKNNHQCRKKIHSESVYFPNDHSFFFLRFYFSRLYSLKKFQEILEMISEMNLFVYNNKNDPNFKAKSILIIKVKFIKLLKILGNVFSFSEINEPVN